LFGPENMGKLLLIIGGVLALIGVLFLFLGRFGLGRLPGDIIIKRENLTIFFPLTTMLLISILLTLIFSILKRF
jgi:multisubunit Na+/H+ antiporter MnhG subunit